MSTTYQRIVATLNRAKPGIDPARIMPSATAVDMKLDSLDQVEFGVELESEFGFDCEQPPFDKVRTLGELEFEIERFIALKRARAA